MHTDRPRTTNWHSVSEFVRFYVDTRAEAACHKGNLPRFPQMVRYFETQPRALPAKTPPFKL